MVRRLTGVSSDDTHTSNAAMRTRKNGIFSNRFSSQNSINRLQRPNSERTIRSYDYSMLAQDSRVQRNKKTEEDSKKDESATANPQSTNLAQNTPTQQQQQPSPGRFGSLEARRRFGEDRLGANSKRDFGSTGTGARTSSFNRGSTPSANIKPVTKPQFH